MAVVLGPRIAPADVVAAAPNLPPVRSIEHVADLEHLPLRRQDRSNAPDVLHIAEGHRRLPLELVHDRAEALEPLADLGASTPAFLM
jgi:hypothetical protein